MKKEDLNWSADSDVTAEFCKLACFSQAAHFVETVLYEGIILVRGTCGKDHEFKALEAECKRLAYQGFAYFGKARTAWQALYRYQHTLTALEFDSHAEEIYNAGNREELEANMDKIRATIPALLEKIKADRR